MRHRYMGDTTLSEKRVLPFMGTVDKLIDQNERARRQIFLERTAGRQRNKIGDAGALENVDIGAIVDVGWRMTMALVVPRQKNNRQPGNLAESQRRRRLAPR